MLSDSPKLAAAAMLLRRSSAGIEVYLVRRAPELEVLGGFHAFPGGRTEDADAEAPVRGAVEDVARRSTAMRELFEETGVLALPGAERIGAAERDTARRALIAGTAARWPELLR